MMDKDFFVCLYKNTERPGDYKAHAVSNFNKFGSTVEKHKESIAATSNETISEPRDPASLEFQRIFEDFTSSMMGFLEMLPLVASIGHTISRSVSSSAIKAYLSRNGEQILTDADREIYRISYEKYADFDGIDQKRKNARQLGKQIPKMMILGVVSSFEHHISSLIKKILISKPEVLSSKNIDINLKEISAFESIADLKNHYIDHQVESIMRESFEKQIEIIEKYLGIKKEIKSDYSGWGDLNEIFERRNLFAHANGVVNKIYISKVPGSKYEIGDFLEVSSKYFSQSIQNLFEFGVKLIFVSWRRICANDLENIDDDLGNFCYAMMEGRQYSLAAKLLEFSLNQASPQTDKRRKMNIINLANCYRLAGDEEKSIQALEVVDWSASGDEFQICVASIRGDLEAVLRMMRTISQDKVEPSFYENWPVFYKVRDSEAFGDTFSEVFGRKYVPAAEDRHSFMELMSLVQEDAVNDKSPAAISEPLAEDHKALNGPKRPIRRRLLNVPAKGGGFK